MRTSSSAAAKDTEMKEKSWKTSEIEECHGLMIFATSIPHRNIM